MKTKHFTTDLLIPILLLSPLALLVIMAGLVLGLPHDTITAAILGTGIAFLLVKEPLMLRLSRRLGLPPPHRIGKSRRA